MVSSSLQVVPLKLSDGATILAEVRRGDREQEVALKEYDLKQLIESLRGVVRDLLEPLSEFACDKIALELGIGLAVKEGQLISLLVSGEATSSIKVTLEWNRQETS